MWAFETETRKTCQSIGEGQGFYYCTLGEVAMKKIHYLGATLAVRRVDKSHVKVVCVESMCDHTRKLKEDEIEGRLDKTTPLNIQLLDKAFVERLNEEGLELEF